MKNFTITYFLLLYGFLGFSQEPFISTWQSNFFGPSSNNEIIIPGTGSNYLIEWEEVGNQANSGAITGNGTTLVTFPQPGTYRVIISGDFTRIEFNNEGDLLKFISIDQWGDIEWESMANAFYGCELLNLNAGDSPDLSRVSNMSHMFDNCKSLNAYIGNWDVSGVTNMSGLFRHAGTFNQPLNEWDVSRVEDMSQMFFEASAFNQPLENWDVSSVKDLSQMFSWARRFNQPIGDWDVSNVETTVGMFRSAIDFNQPLGKWSVSNITDMSEMFRAATSFDQPLENWDVSNVTNMYLMFSDSPFNQPIENWDVGNVEIMVGVFSNNSEFNQPLNNWDVSNVKNFNYMFSSAKSFNQPLDRWDVSSGERMHGVFHHVVNFNQNINTWDVSNVYEMSWMFFGAVSFNQPLGNWDVSSVEDMRSMFKDAESFNQPLKDWDVSNVTRMGEMFSGATVINQPLNNWDVSRVISMEYIFHRATFFNQPLDNWDVSSMFNMRGMFSKASSFDQNLGMWDLSALHLSLNLYLSEMFDYSGMSCESYDLTLRGWNTNPLTPDSIILGAEGIAFSEAEGARDSLIHIKGWTITGDRLGDCPDKEAEKFITTWQSDLPGVTEDNEILIPATGSGYVVEWEEVGSPMNSGMETGEDAITLSFPHSGQYRVSISGNLERIEFNNQGDKLKLISIDQWGAIPWRSMANAFYGCENMEYKATDQPDLSRVESMNAMFSNCVNFDGDIGEWDVSGIRFMNRVFMGATIFNGDIGNWEVCNVDRMTMMFREAEEFNQDIGNWNVDNVWFMNDMFSNAFSFDQNLGNWQVKGNLLQMFDNSGMSCENYDLTLIGWSENPNTRDNRTLGAEGIHYWQAEEARAKLINEKGWTIEGDSFEECNYSDCDLPTPILSIKGPYPACIGEEVLLMASVDGVEYTWFKDGQPLSGESEQGLVVAEAGFYSVIYMDDDNCESEESDALEVSFLDDTAPPVLLNGGDAVLRSTQPNCRGFAFWEAEIEICGDLSEIEKRSLWRLDLHNTGQFDIVSTQPRPDGSLRDNLRIEEELPFGTHRVQWEIRDVHGNLVIEEQLITLVDMNPPTPVCLHGISTNLSPNTGTITIPAEVFDVNSWDDCTASDDLHFTFSSDLTHTHHTWNCDDLEGKSEVTFTVEIWVTNEYGHQNHCVTYLKVQDNREVCPHSSILGPLAHGSDSDVFKPAELPNSEDTPQASAFLLHHNYPNPFNHTTTIDFELPETGPVHLSIYNSYGGMLYHESRVFTEGKNEWRIEAEDLPNSGFYLYKLGFDGEFHPGRMLRIED